MCCFDGVLLCCFAVSVYLLSCGLFLLLCRVRVVALLCVVFRLVVLLCCCFAIVMY